MHAPRTSAPRTSRAPASPSERGGEPAGERGWRRALLARGAALGGGTGVAFALLAWLATADAVTAPRLPDPAPAAASRADCLWYVARNNGFYPLQREVVRAFAEGRTTRSDAASAPALRSWEGFAGTVGAHECGAPPRGPSSVLAALAATADDADRHFLGKTR